MPQDVGSTVTHRRPTIYDVARVAGVSPTTVSHAMSGRGRVHPDTRVRVQSVATSLGYRANPAAQYLAAGSSGTIGLCLPKTGLSRAYYHEVALGAADQALAHGLALTLVPALEDPAGVTRYAVDAFMVVDPRRGDPMLETLRRLRLPVVTGERDLDPNGAWAGVLETDQHDAFVQLLDHMHANGAHRFAAVVSAPEQGWMANTLETYAAWCRLHDIAPRTTRVSFINTPSEVRLAARRLLGSKHPPDAIVGVMEQSALGVLSTATERGIRIPDDLLLASCVDISAHLTAWPSITSLDLQPRVFGARLVDLVVRVLGGERDVADSVKAQLRVRASTRRAPADGRAHPRTGEHQVREHEPASRSR
jgi:DNA-binding LacI/PurR family transcriptional regulator